MQIITDIEQGTEACILSPAKTEGQGTEYTVADRKEVSQ